MIHVTCGPLEGVLVCLCRTLPGGKPFHGRIVPFDLHGGLKSPRMVTIPHRMGRGPRSSCAHEVMNVAFGGTLTTLEDDIIALCTWMMTFGGLGRHLLSLDVMWRLGFWWA
jgi:hypothetical protein